MHRSEVDTEGSGLGRGENVRVDDAGQIERDGRMRQE